MCLKKADSFETDSPHITQGAITTDSDYGYEIRLLNISSKRISIYTRFAGIDRYGKLCSLSYGCDYAEMQEPAGC